MNKHRKCKKDNERIRDQWIFDPGMREHLCIANNTCSLRRSKEKLKFITYTRSRGILVTDASSHINSLFSSVSHRKCGLFPTVFLNKPSPTESDHERQCLQKVFGLVSKNKDSINASSFHLLLETNKLDWAFSSIAGAWG